MARFTIDTDFKTLLVHGDVAAGQIQSFVAAHDLEAFEVKREWPYDQPNCDKILELMRKSITYKRVNENGNIEHQFTYSTIMPNCL